MSKSLLGFGIISKGKFCRTRPADGSGWCVDHVTCGRDHLFINEPGLVFGSVRWGDFTPHYSRKESTAPLLGEQEFSELPLQAFARKTS